MTFDEWFEIYLNHRQDKPYREDLRAAWEAGFDAGYDEAVYDEQIAASERSWYEDND